MPTEDKGKLWKVITKGPNPDNKGEVEDLDTVYVKAKHKNWAARMAVLCTADYWGIKTSEIEARISPATDVKENKLDPKKFEAYVAVSREDFD